MTLETALKTDRTIALAMPFGVLSFWVVSLALRSAQEPGPILGLDPGVVVNLVLGLMLAALVTALMLRVRAVAEGEVVRREGAHEPARLAGLRSKLIVSWALLEAPALLAGVVHFLSGVEPVLWWVGPVYLIGVALTFPRAEWYGVTRR